MLETVKDLGADGSEPVPFSDVSSDTLAKILEYCNYHAPTEMPKTPEEKKEFDLTYINTTDGMLFDLIRAARNLGIKGLLELAASKIGSRLAEECRTGSLSFAGDNFGVQAEEEDDRNPQFAGDNFGVQAEEEDRNLQSEVLKVARKWVLDVQSGRKLAVGDKMQMYDLVHNLFALHRHRISRDELWRAFEASVNLGVAQLLGSPRSIRELHSRLKGNIDALAHFHVYAKALSYGFSPCGKTWGRDLEGVTAVNPSIRQRLGRVSHQRGEDGSHHRDEDSGGMLKLMLQDQLGLPPVQQHSPIGAQDVKRMESLLLPFVAAHPAVHAAWLLPPPYAFVPLPSKVKRTFVLCSKRAESPVSQLDIKTVKRILGFAQCHLRFGGGYCVVDSEVAYEDRPNVLVDIREPAAFPPQPLNDMSIRQAVRMWLRDRAACPDIATWDVHLVTNMSRLFLNSDFNDNIGDWDTGNVTTMASMFRGAQAFNQRLRRWDTRNVRDMSGMFMHAGAFNQPLEFTDTGNVTTMAGMFREADAFNQPLDFNTQRVEDMNTMFLSAGAFEQQLPWDTRNVRNMRGMFLRAGAGSRIV